MIKKLVILCFVLVLAACNKKESAEPATGSTTGSPTSTVAVTPTTTPTSTVTLPTVVTTTLSGITSGTATCGISVSGNTALKCGLCYNTSPAPVVTNYRVIADYGWGAYNVPMRALTANTTYYVRAFASSATFTVYGNEISFTTGLGFSPGQSYGGGVIAYVLAPGDQGYDANIPHGLIAAPLDQDSTHMTTWCNGCDPSDITVFSSAQAPQIGSGNSNTNLIVQAQGPGNYAAGLCYDLVLNGYSDWYLPSKEELNKLFLNKFAIDMFRQGYYWSSTETNINMSGYQDFYTGGFNSQYYKWNKCCVRAIRSF